eukprot:4834738-Prymnesium_polylepis.1
MAIWAPPPLIPLDQCLDPCGSRLARRAHLLRPPLEAAAPPQCSHADGDAAAKPATTTAGPVAAAASAATATSAR